MALELEILTPKEILAKETSVDDIVIPANWGQMEILPEHTDFVTTLTQGEITYRVGTKENAHNISGGLITIKDGKATVLVDSLMATITNIDDARTER